MRAMQLSNLKERPALVARELEQPRAGRAEVLIRVRAAGVTPTELLWYPTTHTKSGAARLNAVPGHEFSGVIEAVGEEVENFRPGQAVYGMNDWFADGATAEFCVTQPQSIASKPTTLTHEAAATVPIGALTAWQGLFDRVKIQPGEQVLVHGGAGAVGVFAVQLAVLHGVRVVATASAGHAEFVAGLGAEEVIDYKAGRFEERVGKVDVVFDTVGGETLERSWGVLKAGGRLVTIAANSEAAVDQRVKGAFLLVEAKQRQLMEIAGLMDTGKLKTFVGAIIPLEEAASAYDGSARRERGRGKVVVSVSA
jgi:NADPH:quinone reductase-like Zn-dependent oxidoreductase